MEVQPVYLVFVLQLCLSSGQLWDGYPVTHEHHGSVSKKIPDGLRYNFLYKHTRYAFGPNDLGEYAPKFLPAPNQYLGENSNKKINVYERRHSTVPHSPFVSADHNLRSLHVPYNGNQYLNSNINRYENYADLWNVPLSNDLVYQYPVNQNSAAWSLIGNPYSNSEQLQQIAVNSDGNQIIDSNLNHNILLPNHYRKIDLEKSWPIGYIGNQVQNSNINQNDDSIHISNNLHELVGGNFWKTLPNDYNGNQIQNSNVNQNDASLYLTKNLHNKSDIKKILHLLPVNYNGNQVQESNVNQNDASIHLNNNLFRKSVNDKWPMVPKNYNGNQVQNSNVNQRGESLHLSNKIYGKTNAGRFGQAIPRNLNGNQIQNSNINQNDDSAHFINNLFHNTKNHNGNQVQESNVNQNNARQFWPNGNLNGNNIQESHVNQNDVLKPLQGFDGNFNGDQIQNSNVNQNAQELPWLQPNSYNNGNQNQESNVHVNVGALHLANNVYHSPNDAEPTSNGNYNGDQVQESSVNQNEDSDYYRKPIPVPNSNVNQVINSNLNLNHANIDGMLPNNRVQMNHLQHADQGIRNIALNNLVEPLGGAQQWQAASNVLNWQGFRVNPIPNNWSPGSLKPIDNHLDCNNFLDVITDLRSLTKNVNVIEEKQNLQLLLRILKTFVVTNKLENLPFDMVVIEIGKALLNDNLGLLPSLRENELIKHILTQFQVSQLNKYFNDLRMGLEPNLQSAVNRLGSLLYQLKDTLIQQQFTQENINLILKRVITWSVPIVSRYFEQECKMKTQNYILNTLEMALNMNVGTTHNVQTVQHQHTIVSPSLGNSQISQVIVPY